MKNISHLFVAAAVIYPIAQPTVNREAGPPSPKGGLMEKQDRQAYIQGVLEQDQRMLAKQSPCGELLPPVQSSPSKFWMR